MRIVTLIALATLTIWGCNITNKKTATDTPRPLVSDTPPAYTINVLEPTLASPRKEMKASVEGVDITINYGSPAMKGRAIWGGLVPMNEVWRTGANEATRLTIAAPVTINGKDLAPGTYGLFTIPRAGQWEFIVNTTADQWGAYEYDAAKDVLRVTTSPIRVEQPVENLDFIMENDQLMVVWEHLRIPVSVKKK